MAAALYCVIEVNLRQTETSSYLSDTTFKFAVNVTMPM